MEDFRLRMGITTSLAPRASASYRGIFLQKSGETLRDSKFTLQEVWNSLYDTGVESSGFEGEGGASLHMQSGELWVVDFVLLHPEVCLGLPVIGLLVLTEPRVGQGQEHEIKACASPVKVTDRSRTVIALASSPARE